MTKVVHFEIPADDTGRARSFWTDVFGVEFQSYDGPMEYHMFANEDKQSGGGLMPRQEGQDGLVVYFGTEDITVFDSTGLAIDDLFRGSRSPRWRRPTS